MKELMFVCPVCGEGLTRGEKSYICPKGHCFDIARQGYVNLLNSSSRGRHGDDKLMVKARADFLSKGLYDPLSREIAACAVQYAPEDSLILDAGCGEGKYTADVLHTLQSTGKTVQMIGIDISKDALIYAAKRSDQLHLAVASSAALPLGSGCADIVLNIFSPFISGEFLRVLSAGGVLIRVYPLERHLWQLKELLYENPYENPPHETEVGGFSQVETRHVVYSVLLRSNAEIMELFKMTPYYYKTSREDQKKAENARSLELTLQFGISVYRKAEL